MGSCWAATDEGASLVFCSERMNHMHLLIPITSCWSVRNVLLTGLADRLKDYFGVTLAVPEGRAECIGAGGWEVTEFPVAKSVEDRSRRLRQRLAKAHLWRVSPKVATYMYQYRSGRQPMREKIYLGLHELLARFDARPERYRRLVTRVNQHEERLHTTESAKLIEWMAACDADAVLLTAPETRLQGSIARCARKLGLASVAMIHSFDNLTTKGRHPILFDYYLVWNEVMKEELLRAYPEIDPNKVRITGTPHFHFYHSPRYVGTREDLAEVYDLDPSLPVLLYAAGPNTLLPHEVETVRRLRTDLDSFPLASRPQLIVRLHPWERDVQRWQSVKEQFGDVRWSIPWETSADDPTWAVPSHQDLREFCTLVRHSDVVINAASTMSLDAAICDTPVVCVDYTLAPFEYFARHMHNFYDYDHYRPIAQSGAVRIARTSGELIRYIKAYLENPALDADARARLVRTMCGPKLDSTLSALAEAVREGLLGETVAA